MHKVHLEKATERDEMIMLQGTFDRGQMSCEWSYSGGPRLRVIFDVSSLSGSNQFMGLQMSGWHQLLWKPLEALGATCDGGKVEQVGRSDNVWMLTLGLSGPGGGVTDLDVMDRVVHQLVTWGLES